jgi:DNA (cytosine-5)-methyltransferase 1
MMLWRIQISKDMQKFNPAQYLESKIKNTYLPNITSAELKGYLDVIKDKIENQKAVYTILITLLVKKIESPEIDIRNHRTKLKNGFSGRTYDTTYITPTLKKNGLPAMAESAYLTRSLEQHHALDLKYPGKIRDIEVKNAFLNIIDIFQKNPKCCEEILNFLLSEGKRIKEGNIIPIIKIENKEKFSINDIIKKLKELFFYNYKTSGGSKLPVVCFFSLINILNKEIKKYQNKKIKNMGFHTTSDKTSQSSGDIEILERNGNIYESYDIKFEKDVDNHMLLIVYEKIKKFNPKRYFILTTKEFNIEILNEKITEIKKEHGCQLIVENYMNYLKYLLYLIEDINEFINDFTANIQNDKELKIIHKKKWKEILEKTN